MTPASMSTKTVSVKPGAPAKHGASRHEAQEGETEGDSMEGHSLSAAPLKDVWDVARDEKAMDKN